MAVPRRSGNASGAGRYSGQAIATTPGSAYRCITKGGDQGPAVSGQHDRPGVPRYDHLRDVIRRAAMPATEIGRAHVWTTVTNAPLVCRLLLETNHTIF